MGYTTDELGFILKQGQGTDFFSTASGHTQHPVQDVEGFGVWATQYICVFRIVLRIKNDYTPSGITRVTFGIEPLCVFAASLWNRIAICKHVGACR